MNKIIFSLFLALIIFSSARAYGFSTMGEDCSKCHTLTKDEATAIVKNLNPGLGVLDVKSGPLRGLWEITISTGGQKVLGYIDFSKKYLINGEVIDLKGKKNLTNERLIEINKIDVSTIPLDDALIMGDKNAHYKVIVFDDPG